MKSKEEIEQLLKKGRHFCIAPWVHLHVTSLGFMISCCGEVKGPYARGFGHLDKSSFRELWQGQSIRKFRLKMLNDEANPRCRACYEQDNLGLRSLRNSMNSIHQKYIDWVVNTDQTGFAADAKPVDWDIRFSNVCNLRCRSCNSFSSSRWSEETEAGMPGNSINSGKFITGLTDAGRLLDELNGFLPFVNKITFAGGEPLLMDENYRILKKLDDLKKYDVELLFITNMTRLHHKNYDLLSLWKNFKKLSIAISLDGIGGKCEYLRNGLNWDKVLKNWEEVKRECPDARILVNYTVSAFNILHLPDFHREVVEKKYAPADAIKLIFLYSPMYYSAKILTADLKKHAAKKIREHIAWLKKHKPFNEEKNLHADSFRQWEACIHYMNGGDWTHLIPQFVRKVNRLDRLRHENCLGIFPELRPVFETAAVSILNK